MAGHSTCAPGDDEPCDSLSPHACRPSFGVTNIVVYHGSDPVRRVGGARRRRVPGDDGVRAAHLRIPEAAAVRHWLLVDDSPGGAANHRTCGDDGGGGCHRVSVPPRPRFVPRHGRAARRGTEHEGTKRSGGARAFAGGISYFAGYPAIHELDERVLRKIRSEAVPFVLVASELASGFALRFPLTSATFASATRRCSTSRFATT